MSNKIIIINGPNINLLGEREQSQYGSISFGSLKEKCIKKSKEIEPYCDCSLSPNRLRFGPLIIIILLFIQLLYTMKKIKKIKIKINGSFKFVKDNTNLSDFLNTLKIPLKKVAIELNQEILDKKKLNKQILRNNDKIEIVHFIGGG